MTHNGYCAENGGYPPTQNGDIRSLIQLFRWRKRSIPTHSEWLYPLTFDAGNGLKEA